MPDFVKRFLNVEEKTFYFVPIIKGHGDFMGIWLEIMVKESPGLNPDWF